MKNLPRDRHIPDLVSLAEAAQIMGMTRQAAHQLVQRGLLVGAQVGTTWVFRRSVAEAHRKAGAAA